MVEGVKGRWVVVEESEGEVGGGGGSEGEVGGGGGSEGKVEGGGGGEARLMVE